MLTIPRLNTTPLRALDPPPLKFTNPRLNTSPLRTQEPPPLSFQTLNSILLLSVHWTPPPLSLQTLDSILLLLGHWNPPLLVFKPSTQYDSSQCTGTPPPPPLKFTNPRINTSPLRTLDPPPPPQVYNPSTQYYSSQGTGTPPLSFQTLNSILLLSVHWNPPPPPLKFTNPRINTTPLRALEPSSHQLHFRIHGQCARCKERSGEQPVTTFQYSLQHRPVHQQQTRCVEEK